MKILHIGLCVQPEPYNGFQKAFIDVIGKENYREVSTGSQFLVAEVMTILNDFTPEIVFMQVQAPNIIPISLLQHLQALGCYVINWNGDKRHEVPQWMIDIAPYVNCTSFSNMDDVNAMRSLGYHSEYLEIGYDPDIYTPYGEKLDVPEIVFMGNNYGHGYFPMSTFRIEMVDFLQKEYGSRFGVYGSGWVNGNGNFNHSQHEEAKAYRGAKIAINVSHFDSLNYNSDRLLRILGSGVMCLSYEHLGMDELYGRIPKFKDFSLLKKHIDYYLNDKITRFNIANANNRFVNKFFTFKKQVENIINLAI